MDTGGPAPLNVIRLGHISGREGDPEVDHLRFPKTAAYAPNESVITNIAANAINTVLFMSHT